jgi:hypothetical protein
MGLSGKGWSRAGLLKFDYVIVREVRQCSLAVCFAKSHTCRRDENILLHRCGCIETESNNCDIRKTWGERAGACESARERAGESARRAASVSNFRYRASFTCAHIRPLTFS